ncbi:hypothetical protein MNEG_12818 [Monoraphidium neglectum]|uniref:Splicing factor YJU2 n=1 Tax=Monoraphidium neglectum TaxID=145388 RepID=A0A0D2LU20_9CHLO|nr:hypothetical protein MNEG_12818 [Monoraphidium neglectum]KIY95144.1 hypothetical protein MNEG_12818 [Monoraphidium neglectum]|eukprot:XP_013894164.1 hypothetical protein MNEG_12818 [Monoraphidium neglectum]
MGERKVLNKYYPPDFDPSKLPKGKRGKHNEMKVRMMLPMSVRCKTCGNFMYKGTKFNTLKEDVAGEDYLGIQVFRFYYRCTKCAAEFTMKTDPKTADYVMEHGASRNYEPWREADAAKADAAIQKEEEERGNAMKALENRTLESKREMDLMDTLDEMRSLRARHAGVTPEQALAALAREEFMAQKRSILAQRLDSDEEEEGGGAAGAAGPSGAGLQQQQQQQQQEPAARPQAARAAAAARPGPLVKVVVKPKRKAGADDGAAKRQKQQQEEAEGDEDSGAGGLAGLLGDYGSGSGSGSGGGSP